MIPNPVYVLLVEDNPNDTLMIIRALGEPYTENLQAVEDGIEALAYLRRQGQYMLAPRPDVVLLDLKIPRKDGWQVLSEIRAEPALKSIPVIILTALDTDDGYLQRCVENANALVPKVLSFEEFTNELRGKVALLAPAPGPRSASLTDRSTQSAS